MMLLIYKAEKILELWEGGNLRATYPIGVGKEFGPKELEGDMKTPEGDYVICVKNPQSKYHLSLGLNYPNDHDAEKGLNASTLTPEEFGAIIAANAAGEIPPWKTKLGGEIYIHGGLEDQAWSAGCIRLNNKDIAYFFDAISIGTKVFIRP